MRNRKKASLTVEAALVLPLFTCAVLSLCFLFRLIYLEVTVQSAISGAASDVASYGYALNRAQAVGEEKKNELLEDVPLGSYLLGILTETAEETALKTIVSLYVDRGLFDRCRVVGGWNGISFAGSRLHTEDDLVAIIVRYSVDIPFVGRILPAVEVVQNAGAAVFSGEIPHFNGNSQKDDTDIVYVTKNGTVYHTSPDCTHLKLSTKQVASVTVPSLRNMYGHKYYPCEFCVKKKTVPENVYITVEGERYHINPECIGLRRYIREVKLSETDLPKCSRCAARENKEGAGGSGKGE